MTKKLLRHVIGRLAGLHRDCQGFVVMSTLAIFLFLFLLCSFVYAVGETIHQRIKMQNACDAAAYSAAVVQADGLSRMAVVNRAMAWSYVQMTNRQMDYITYRWLKLTCKRFGEDLNNARKYHAQLVLGFDYSRGWWALLEAAVSTLQSAIFGAHCNGQHHWEDVGWWCGFTPQMGGPKPTPGHKIRMNVNPHFSIGNIASASLSHEFITYDVLKDKVLPLVSFIDNGDTPYGWGYYLGKWIDYDKKNIYRMNRALNRINKQMTISMRMTAESVLKSMLKDSRFDKDSVLKDYYISIHIPEAEDPYDGLDDPCSAPKSFFSPLHNNEADEMLFLNMQSAENSNLDLSSHFKVFLGGDLAYGLDQWFIRGKGNYEGDVPNEQACYEPQKKNLQTYDGKRSGRVTSEIRLLSTERDEAGLGIQRVYKDANINEAKSGIWNKPVSRGNHILELGSNFNIQNGGNDSFFGELATNVFNAIVNFASTYADIQPSCDNVRNKARIGMCRSVNDTRALYSEWEWASSKWFCLARGLEDYEIGWFFNNRIVYCGGKKKRLRGFLPKVRGYGHWQFPKWFCGEKPRDIMDGIVPQAYRRFVDVLDLSKYLPPLFGQIKNTHGYMKNTYDITTDGFFKPLKPLLPLRSSYHYSRDEYNSCAASPDGSWETGLGFKEGTGRGPEMMSVAGAAPIRGHSRIYGDDKEIFDNRYVGAKCKPWVLNERFFAGDGTIVVGAARRHTNPLVQLFNFWNTTSKKDDKGNVVSRSTGSETQEDAERTFLSAFNIPKNNFMWTMSAARAGVRHTRRDGKFDQARQYQIAYDSVCDVENLSYNSGPYVRKEDGTWGAPDGEWSSDNPNALSRIHRPVGEKQELVPVWSGCPCGKSARQLRDLWNLCETDWDATLIPVRYAGQKAQLYLKADTEDEGTGDDSPFNELNYSERRSRLDNMFRQSASNPDDDEKARNDKVIGDGRNWVWNDVITNKSTLLTNNPFIHANWKPADNAYFSLSNIFFSLIPEELSTGISMLKGLNLNNKIPTGKGKKTIDVFTVFRDRVL